MNKAEITSQCTEGRHDLCLGYYGTKNSNMTCQCPCHKSINYTKGEIKTLGEAWKVLKEHGLEGTYCPHCDQFAQARVLQKQDELISDMYEALIQAMRTFQAYRIKETDPRYLKLRQAADKAEGK